MYREILSCHILGPTALDDGPEGPWHSLLICCFFSNRCHFAIFSNIFHVWIPLINLILFKRLCRGHRCEAAGRQRAWSRSNCWQWPQEGRSDFHRLWTFAAHLGLGSSRTLSFNDQIVKYFYVLSAGSFWLWSYVIVFQCISSLFPFWFWNAFPLSVSAETFCVTWSLCHLFLPVMCRAPKAWYQKHEVRPPLRNKPHESPQAEDGGVGLRLAWEMVNTYGPTAFIVPFFLVENWPGNW